jgi:ankyrin repeat protein
MTLGPTKPSASIPLPSPSMVEVVPVLLEHGANVGAEDTKGKIPLHLAASDEVVRMLLEHGAN